MLAPGEFREPQRAERNPGFDAEMQCGERFSFQFHLRHSNRNIPEGLERNRFGMVLDQRFGEWAADRETVEFG